MLNAIYFYRVSHWLYCHHIPVLPKLITLFIFLIYNSKSKYPGVPTIGDNVRISCGSIVFGGFTVGNNVVIGAHTVVNFPVPDNAVVVGNPGRIVRIGGEKC